MTFRRQILLSSACFCVLFSGFQKILFAQATVQWSDPIEVVSADLGTDNPRLALNTAGDPVVLWGKGGTPNTIRLARWQNGAFSAPQLISTGGINPGVFDYGGLDLAIFGNSVYVVFERFDHGIYLTRSTDQGTSFDPPVAVFSPGSGRVVTLPSVAVNAGGTILVSYLFETINATNAVYYVSRSTDGGLSFLPPVEASAPANGDYVCECCPSDIATSGDSVWLAFRSLRTGNVRDVWVAGSTDQGAGFDTALDVDSTDWVQFVCPSSGPRMQVTGDSLVTVWMSRGTGSTRIHGASSGRHASVPGAGFIFEFSGQFSTQNHPDIAGNADTLGVVWEETGIPGTGTDILFAFSTDGAYALPSRISNLSATTGTQKAPALAYRNGTFHLVYADALSGRLLYRKGVVTGSSPTTTIAAAPVVVSAAPNPASSFIRVDWSQAGALDFQLVDTRGRLCRSWQVVLPGTQLLLNGLEPGWYGLQYRNAVQAGAQKILIR